MADKKVKENENETPADEPAAEIAEEAVAEVTVDEPEAADEPVADAPAEEPVAEAPAEEPVAEAPAEEAPVAEEPVEDAPAVEEASEEPAAEAVADEPATELAAPVAGAVAVEAAPAPQSVPKPKKKRLPRSLRPKKTRPTRTKATERKPIVRLEKPEHERGRSQERLGTVVSDAMDKTIVVKVDVIKSHRKYKKVVRRSVKFHAHDETNSAHVGDTVRIVETRPLSATKRWRLTEIVEVAK